MYPQKYGQPKTVYPEPELELEQSELPGVEQPKSSEQLGLDLPQGEPYVIENPLAEDVRKWGMWVLEEAREEIAHLYEDPEGRKVVGYFWARTAKCPNPACGADMPMVRQWWLAKTDRRRAAIRMVVDKKAKKVSFEIAVDDEIDFDPDEGTMRRDSISCPICGQSPNRDYLRGEGQAHRLEQVLIAVALSSDAAANRLYRAPTRQDYELFEQALETLATYSASADNELAAVPDEPLPYLRSIFNVHVYGMQKWGDLFNSRQALAAVVFARKVTEAYEAILKETTDTEYAIAVATYLALTVDRLLDYSTMLCTWVSSGEFIGHTFGRQALGMVWDYVELNPFSGSSGDWQGALSWVTRVIEHCSEASDYIAHLNKASATRLPFPSESLDAVITDPPYYDAVPYADLSDFFFVWLKRSIGKLYPDVFSTPLTPKSTEIVQLAERNVAYAHKDKAFYEEQLTYAFSESCRVLDGSGIFLVVFAHKSTAAWETLINSLLQSGLIVTASWPLHTERSSRLRAMDSGALASSIFIVCRKRAAQEEGFYDDVKRELRERIAERLSFFWSESIRGADFFISAIGPAVEVFGRYSAVRKLSGDLVGVAELLDLVQEAVADYALGQIMNGRYKMGTVDAPTRFYVMYRWSYSDQKLVFDDARRLAQALGAEVNDLIHRHGLLIQSGESVTMPGPTGRKKVEHLGESGRDGIAAPIIDVLHRAVLIWQSGDRQKLAQYLATHALGREEAVNAVAQALVNVLPQGDKERQLLENYLQGSGNLPDVPRTERLPGI